MSCILTEETNTSYLTYFKGFTWVRQRVVKKSLQRCELTLHFTFEKTEANEHAGFSEEHPEPPAVLLLYLFFRKLSCCPLTTKHSSEFFLPQTEHAPLGTNVTKVSLTVLARPPPPYDSEKGKLLRPDGCHDLQFLIKLCKKPQMTEYPSPYCYYLLILNHSGFRSRRWVVVEVGENETSILCYRHQIRARLAIKVMQYFLEFLFVHSIKGCLGSGRPSVKNCRKSKLRGKRG